MRTRGQIERENLKIRKELEEFYKDVERDFFDNLPFYNSLSGRPNPISRRAIGMLILSQSMQSTSLELLLDIRDLLTNPD